MNLIDKDALLAQMKQRKWYVGRASDPVCLVEDAPTIDAVPYERIGRLLADTFSSPCNYSPMDEEMLDVCEDKCDMNDPECWIRWIRLRLEGKHEDA